MKTLKIPSEEPLSVFEEIRRKKRNPRRKRLEALTQQIKQRYRCYEDRCKSIADLTTITPTPFSTQEGADLEHCYEGKTEPLNQLKSHIRSIQTPYARSTCQYCGISEPSTFDHYLPKVDFPGLAVHPTNLIPCCSLCNTERRSEWRKNTGLRTCLHLYFDKLCEQRILRAVLADSSRRPVRYRIETPSSPSAEHYARHCKHLKLIERYESQGIAYLSQIRTEIKRLSAMSLELDIVCQFYRKKAEELAIERGVNNWKVALLYEVAQAREFIESCLPRTKKTS